MFNNTPLTSSFSISKLVGGLSKTLGVVNQVIPIYKEAKPMVQNAKNAFNLIKEFSNTTSERIQNNVKKNVTPLKEQIDTIKNSNYSYIPNKKGPTFFV